MVAQNDLLTPPQGDPMTSSLREHQAWSWYTAIHARKTKHPYTDITMHRQPALLQKDSWAKGCVCRSEDEYCEEQRMSFVEFRLLEWDSGCQAYIASPITPGANSWSHHTSVAHKNYCLIWEMSSGIFCFSPTVSVLPLPLPLLYSSTTNKSGQWPGHYECP